MAGGGMTGTLLCFGYGYCAAALARRLLAKGWTIRGTTRNPDRLATMRAQGVEPFLFDRNRPLPAAAFDGAGHALTSIAPDEAGDPVLDLHAADLRGTRWCGYLGTTAVYGNHDGGWVDETTPLQPSIARADRRVLAEAAWLGSGLPAHVFRLAGIYGPGRNPLVNLERGTARRIVKPGQVFSRIHVEDIAATLEASMARPRPGAVYNVCDDEPAPPQDVVAFAARLLGVEPPPELPYDTAELPPMARSFYRDNRRVRNGLIKRELGVHLAYPTYREGLRALADGFVTSADPSSPG